MFALFVPVPVSRHDVYVLQTMESIIRRCLDIAEDCALTSITFPAIGTGNLAFPKTVFAKLIISEVLSFSTQRQLKTLQEVHIMLYPKDHENIEVHSHSFLPLRIEI